MKMGYYKCECGKEFTNPQSFNGHKCHCEIFQFAKYGSLDAKIERENKFRECALEQNRIKHEESNERKNAELLEWILSKPRCERCGKIMTEKFGSGRFCSRACSNSRNHSSETKEKIKIGVKKSIPRRRKRTNAPSVSSFYKEKYYSSPKTCIICGNTLSYEQRNRKTCSDSCKNKLLKQIQDKLVSSGQHKYWISRDKLSYAEEFWMNVLLNNNIGFEHNFSCPCYNTCYFLDFFIYPNIDLEIDGKQHYYKDRKEHDILRDYRLSQKGLLVYRIKYINPKNSEQVKNQIDDFLNWYYKIINKNK